jgi:hypothetical protein
MVLNPEPPDAILLLEFGAANHPLELVLQDVKPGQPADIRAHLEALHILDGLFVYRAADGEIVTAGEYLAKEPA